MSSFNFSMSINEVTRFKILDVIKVVPDRNRRPVIYVFNIGLRK